MIAMKESGIEWIGQIPKNWNIVRLGALASMIVPMRDKPTSFDGDIPWIRIEDFDGMYISKSKSEQNVSAELIKQMNMKIYPVGTVLCSCSCNLGKCAITTVPMCSNQTFIGVVPQGDLHNRFLYYVLSASEKILNNMSQGAIQSYLSQQDFSKFKIAITDFESQIKIADFLDKKCTEIDSIISAKEKVNELLKERRQSIIYESVTKGLDPDIPMKDSGIEWVGDIAEHFQVIRLKYLCKVFGRIGFRGYTQADLVAEGEGPITLSPSNICDRGMDYSKCTYLTWEKYEESPEIQISNGDILLVKTGSSYGKSAIVENLPMEATINPQFVVVKDILCNSKYLSYFMQTSLFEYQVEQAVVGGTIPTMAQEKINNFYIFLPSKDECKEIAEYLDKRCSEIDTLILANNTTIEKLKEYRQSIIYEAVTGKIEI